MKNFFDLLERQHENMEYGRNERNDKMVIYNYVSCDLTFVTRDSKSSYKSSDSRMLNSTVLIFFLNSDLGNTRSFVGNSFHTELHTGSRERLSFYLQLFGIKYK